LTARQLDSSTARQLDCRQLDISTARQLVQLLDSSTELDSSTQRVDATSYDGSTDDAQAKISAFGVTVSL
jgi:hypothetical protein